MLKISKIFILSVAISLMVAAPSIAAQSVMDSDVIRVGTEATYPPFEYRNEKNEITGYDIDVVKALGAHLGKKVELVDMAFDGLIPALLTGKIDMIAAGMTNTEERRKKVDFSDVYYEIENAFVTKADDASISKIEDFAGKVATVQIGTAQDTFITNTKLPKEIKRFQKNDDALREVLLERADFCVVNLTVANAYLRNNEVFGGKLKIAFRNFIHKQGEGIALAIPKGDVHLKEAINEAMDEMKKSGKLLELKKKYQMD
ncbi:MAG: transporter substrate-binding domain-containing protein [Aminobacterium sp.]|uniref:transporter substrate-binding domain-containing protein n=1 Tax=Aminobacterium sp. TaxID=1872491 RepID=UPI001BCC3A1C|nr:transporter substrate-binding domain-containing protein [Aminobacterium sp.]MDD2207312.1 transporter substrate-binding domain-containing protein [Aminobacterium sp.]MDD3426522.1 transporter substrate-binding domain-containing protein [Aminobacterium sp.]MDD3707395.1 transporter substrate-binding domain-containing protein [Aminobacterium sp.]MDD4229397.1 transporter substrate-binding domain-containing protein [Aminobacterium sp.]MDD4552245.1 transporter substrate-binding domain-containing pr